MIAVSDNRVVTEVGKLDDGAKSLIVQHMEIGRRLAWKLLFSWQARLPEDDVQSIVGIALCEAAKNYDGRPGTQFQTFFYYHLRGRLLREITEIVEQKKFHVERSESYLFDASLAESETDYSNADAISLDHNNPEQIAVDKEEKLAFDSAFDSLDWLEREVINRHYFHGESLIELAEVLNYCRCHLSRVKARAISKLKKSIQNSYHSDAYASNDLSSDMTLVSSSYKGGRGRRKNKTKKIGLRKKLSSSVREEVLHAVSC